MFKNNGLNYTIIDCAAGREEKLVVGVVVLKSRVIARPRSAWPKQSREICNIFSGLLRRAMPSSQ